MRIDAISIGINPSKTPVFLKSLSGKTWEFRSRSRTHSESNDETREFSSGSE